MHFLGFNVMPRRIPDFPDSFYKPDLGSAVVSYLILSFQQRRQEIINQLMKSFEVIGEQGIRDKEEER